MGVVIWKADVPLPVLGSTVDVVVKGGSASRRVNTQNTPAQPMQQGSAPMFPAAINVGKNRWEATKVEGRLMRLGKIENKEISPPVFPGDAGARRDFESPCSFLLFKALPIVGTRHVVEQSKSADRASVCPEFGTKSERILHFCCLSLLFFRLN